MVDMLLGMLTSESIQKEILMLNLLGVEILLT
jgi:hypothetical protein